MSGVAIIGFGKTGRIRAQYLPQDHKLIGFSDTDPSVEGSVDPIKLIHDKRVESVIVSTPHKYLSSYGAMALEAGKNVLLEKPGAMSSAELKKLQISAERVNKVLAIGFNHRFHPAIQEAKARLLSGAIGELMYIRARYGHGARLGYETEWRARPELSGGGELLDQGVHLIDLCRYFAGDFSLVFGKAYSFYWKMPVEDSGTMVLQSRAKANVAAFLHVSCTEWKNLFDFELFGTQGKLQIFGLGKSYGIEELRIYKMKPEMGPPDIEIIQYPGEDLSWNRELDAFFGAIRGESNCLARVNDGIRAFEMVEQVYQSE